MLLAHGLDGLVFAAFVYLLRPKGSFGDCFTVHLIFTEFQLFEIREIVLWFSWFVCVLFFVCLFLNRV